MFNWFDTKLVESFGISLADFVIESVMIESGKQLKNGVQLREKTLNVVARRVTEFSQANPLNLYKKAKFATAFKWRMQEAELDEAFIDALTKVVMLRL